MSLRRETSPCCRSAEIDWNQRATRLCRGIRGEVLPAAGKSRALCSLTASLLRFTAAGDKFSTSGLRVEFVRGSTFNLLVDGDYEYQRLIVVANP